MGTHVFLNGHAYPSGAVALAVTAPYVLRSVVSQGASPIGQAWTITEADGNLVQSIGGRPAYEVLVETLRALPPDLFERARTGLLVGLAMDEYRDTFSRGDFLIRNLLGYHRETGALAISALPRAGQTLQFQFRDAEAAGEDLREQLAASRKAMGRVQPVAALLCSCNGRGSRMFETPDHDARALDGAFPGLPVAGLFCAGEIGSVGGRTFLHGFTASIGLIVREGAP
jgi:small ligand-binding sensory domain FIST